MKKFYLLSLFALILNSCTNNDDAESRSFIVKNSTSLDFENCVVGYEKDGKWVKLVEFGDLNKKSTTSKIQIDDPSIEVLYVFVDYFSIRKIDIAFNAYPNYKNIFEIPWGARTVIISDKTDPTQYPQ